MPKRLLNQVDLKPNSLRSSQAQKRESVYEGDACCCLRKNRFDEPFYPVRNQDKSIKSKESKRFSVCGKTID